MPCKLQEMLGLSGDSQALDLAVELEHLEDELHDQARRGNREASQTLVRLRIAYLAWAYGHDGAPGTGLSEALH